MSECSWCANSLVKARTGRPKLYCGQRCRQAAWRRRKWYAEVDRLLEMNVQRARLARAHAEVDADPFGLLLV